MPSFGEEIRRERELREISLREVAEATKINLRYLEAMERNDFAYLPGGLFNRGFVRAYCSFIGVDPEAMVNAYLLEERTQASPDRSRNGDLLRGMRANTDTSVEKVDNTRSRVLLKWGLLLLGVVLVAASAWLLFVARGGTA